MLCISTASENWYTTLTFLGPGKGEVGVVECQSMDGRMDERRELGR